MEEKEKKIYEMTRILFSTSKELRKEIKKRCIDRNMTQREWINMAIIEMIRKEDLYQ